MSAHVRRLPVGSILGLVVIGLGLSADLLAHLDPTLDHAHGDVTGAQLSAHLATFVGMALVLAGVVLDGIRSTARRKTSRS